MALADVEVTSLVWRSVPEDWHRHENGGGWVHKHARVEAVVYVGRWARISGGVISGGEISGGEISGGEISGGVISGGVISGGVISGGVISGGVISGWARISGGEISGGEISGGVISGGVFLDGDVISETPFTIQGTRHIAVLVSAVEVSVGCQRMPISDWFGRRGRAVARVEGYTAEQITEYAEHIAYLEHRAKELARARVAAVMDAEAQRV